jgi:hypothetical protein
MDLAQFNAFYSAAHSAVTAQIDADYGAGTAAALPPGLLQMLITLFMSLIPGCNPTPTPPTPASLKAAAAANVGYIEAKAMLAMGFTTWRHHGKKLLASAMKVIAAAEETPTGLLGQAIALADAD